MTIVFLLTIHSQVDKIRLSEIHTSSYPKSVLYLSHQFSILSYTLLLWVFHNFNIYVLEILLLGGFK